jgi:O-antigen/teichoic acid export membrane protein
LDPMRETLTDDWREGLKIRILSASAWAVASSTAGQAIRFASNLILSRLLFPEAFGLIALASAVLAGLDMFTDLGIGPSIIRNPEPTRRFLDTLWSLQVVRGWGLWAISAIIAYPMAQWYGEPELTYLIPAMGLTSIVRGYAHTSQFTLNRDLQLRKLFHLEIVSQIINVVIAAITAYEMRSVWAMVIGAFAGSLTRCVLTYWQAVEPRRHWCWDRDVLNNMRGFSRWILLSTVLTYFTNQGDSLILGLFISITDLGVYSIANAIAAAVFQFINLIGSRVLFPMYGKVGRETTPLLKRRVVKVRLAMMGVILPPLWAMTCFGDWAIRLLWDPRYWGAGPMLQILCGGSLFLAFGAGPLFLARGEAWIGFIYGSVRAAVLLPAMVVGGNYLGTIGLVWGIAISQAVHYPLEVWVQRRYGVWVPWLDAAGLGSSVVFITLGFLLRSSLNF